MELLKLNFDTEVLGEKRVFTVEVPYSDGDVATSEYCPVELLSGYTDLLAAIRGESLEDFTADIRRQLLALSLIDDAETELDRHIGALMAVVMDHLSRNGNLLFSDLLLYVDCFSLLLKSSGHDEPEIKKIYPHIVGSIAAIYPARIQLDDGGTPLSGTPTETVLRRLTERRR